MNTEVNFHPSTDFLEGFAAGSLSAGKSVVISAHVELCESCKQQVSTFEAKAADKWSTGSEEGTAEIAPAAEGGYANAIANITSQPQLKAAVNNDSALADIHMLDHSVRLPKVLAKAAAEGLVWKKLAGGINQATVILDDETQCEFIYMKPGSQVPVHKHLGNEITLVLDGSFSDELGHYSRSDFVVRNKEHTHCPASEEGCLCFAVLDSPLTFTSGIARLLNPILRYRFHRATSMHA